MTDRITELNGPRVRCVDGVALDATLFPDDRITCGDCVRVLTKVDTPDKCPLGMKQPPRHRHRCWYFKAQPGAADRKPGHVRYATDDPNLRRALGYIAKGD